MPLPSPSTPTVVTIGGSAVSMPRPVVPRRLVVFTKGGIESFSYSVRGGALRTSADPYLGKEVTVAVDGTLRFKGDVTTRALDFAAGLGWVYTYQCLGLRNRLDWVPHTDGNDGGDSSDFNLSSDNGGTEYQASRAGRTVGQILTAVLTMVANAQAINALGIGNYTGLPSAPALPASTVADLAGMTVIPKAPVHFGGEKIGGAIEGLLANVAPNFAFRVEPGGDMRFLDTRAFTNYTLTMGTDPIRPTPLSRDVADCFSRVLVRGQQIAEMFGFDLLNGGLSESPFAHDGLTVAQAKAAWTPADFNQPGLSPGQATASVSLLSGAVSSLTPSNQGYGYGSTPAVTITGDGTGATATATLTGGQVTGFSVTAGGSGYTTATAHVGAPVGPGRDAGTCTCPSTTTVTITSGNLSTAFPSNFWDQSGGGRHGVLLLAYSAGTTITTYAQRLVTANGAMSPGGTATLTLDRALPHLLYDSYLLCGTSKGASDVWTKYALPSWAGAKVAPQSTYPFAYQFANGAGVVQTSTPMGTVEYGNGPPYGSTSVGVAVDAGSGTVQFSYPTFLTAGGATPHAVRALVPIYTAVNQAIYPPDSGGSPVYGGTCYTAEAISRTLTVTVPSWRDPADASAMLAYAQDLFDSVSQTVIEGQVEHLGYFAPALVMGAALSVAGNGYTTGWESAALPILEAQVDWNVDGVNMVTTMKCSNRRAHWSSADQFMHPERTGLTLDFGATLNYEPGPGRFGDTGPSNPSPDFGGADMGGGASDE